MLLGRPANVDHVRLQQVETPWPQIVRFWYGRDEFREANLDRCHRGIWRPTDPIAGNSLARTYLRTVGVRRIRGFPVCPAGVGDDFVPALRNGNSGRKRAEPSQPTVHFVGHFACWDLLPGSRCNLSDTF